eukprot:scaffold22398_cov102-Isochrysis_galbana.AAC.3
MLDALAASQKGAAREAHGKQAALAKWEALRAIAVEALPGCSVGTDMSTDTSVSVVLGLR